MEEIMQSIISAIARHIGAGMRYFFLRIICRRKDVSYKSYATAIKRILLHITITLLPMAAWAWLLLLS